MPADREACVALWTASCADRDGVAHPGVAERARPKFDHSAGWVVAEDARGHVLGFALATAAGTGVPTDPPDAALLGLLAVHPSTKGRGVGRLLLTSIEGRLAAGGCETAVLHVLTDNAVAVRLYEAAGWRPLGAPFEHSLLGRPTQTYVRRLGAPESSTSS
ncbi:hypothetical protein GCM10025780_07640 [Frondihabitans cladoniiphilus]|uniref:N-acetyltransferase domain-containing protein n=2 Tax=Frondihabitans cladoniiphilus TaxID=715785 RepID=A0ABP8VMI7_9MICO